MPVTSKSSYLGRRQHKTCPAHFQERLTRAGGLNRYGQPNFIIVWGMSWMVRRGGEWDADDGSYFRGYRDIVEDGRPCWILKQWKGPEVQGTSTMWFIDNYCPKTGMQLLGDYPWRGSYETVQPFVWRGLVNGRMVVESMPLNATIIDMVVPIIIKCQSATATQKKIAFEQLREREDKEKTRYIEAKRQDARLAFRGPVSYARQQSRTSIVQRKEDEISKHWQANMARFRGRGLGTSIIN